MILKNSKHGLLMVAAGLMSAGVVQAQTVNIGIVDEYLVGQGYTALKNEAASIDQRAGAIDTQIQARNLLTADEGKAFDALITNLARTPAQNTQFDALVKAGTDRQVNYVALNGKVTRSDTEMKQLKDWQQLIYDNKSAVQKDQDDLDVLFRKLIDDTDAKYRDNVNKVVGQVATEQKMTLVLRKSAAMWNVPAIDITDAVLKKLNQ